MDNKKFWEFEGVTKHTMKELVIAEIIKLVIFRIFKADTKVSYRISAELIPVEHRIETVKQEREKEEGKEEEKKEKKEEEKK